MLSCRWRSVLIEFTLVVDVSRRATLCIPIIVPLLPHLFVVLASVLFRWRQSIVFEIIHRASQLSVALFSTKFASALAFRADGAHRLDRCVAIFNSRSAL